MLHKILLAISILLATSVATADLLKCELSSGSEKQSVVLNLHNVKEAEEGAYPGDAIYDLTFFLNAECEGNSCVAGVTIDSGIVEDELLSFGFDFERNGMSSVLVDEPLEDAPDGRDYHFFCEYTGIEVASPL